MYYLLNIRIAVSMINNAVSIANATVSPISHLVVASNLANMCTIAPCPLIPLSAVCASFVTFFFIYTNILHET